jgi:hypothetical protein
MIAPAGRDPGARATDAVKGHGACLEILADILVLLCQVDEFSSEFASDHF